MSGAVASKVRAIHGCANSVTVEPSRYTVVIPLKGTKSLAYNTASRAFAVWSDQERQDWDDIVRAKRTPYSPRLRTFVQGGFCVSEHVDEVAQLRANYDRTRNDDSHIMFTVAPTLSCNFACYYCFQGLDKPLTKMSNSVREATKKFLLAQLEGRRSVHLTWYGGEPLMDQTSIFELSDALIKKCDRDGIRYTAMMVSNGYRMTLDVSQRLKAARVGTVQITIDGDAESHDARRHLTSGRGTFDKILNNIQIAAEQRLLKTSIRVNIDDGNDTEARRLMDVLVQRGLGIHNGVSIYFAPVEGMAEANACDNCIAKTDYAKLEVALMNEAFEKGLSAQPVPPRFMGICTAMKSNSHVVVPNGDLHKCWDTVMDPRLRVGSVIGGPRSTDASMAAKWNTWSPFDNPVCSDCTILPNCAGACAFKFVHNDYTGGEAAKLPCPSMKFNLAEQLFLRARIAGHVSDADWDPERSPTVTDARSLTGQRHSYESVSAIYESLVGVAAE